MATVPTQLATQIDQSLRLAEQSDANQIPLAALHLQLAHEQASVADTLMREGDFERARWLLLRAAADADLALALAQEGPLRDDARNATDALQAARKQIELQEE